MRYCPYCKRLNSGKPTFCAYCSRTFEVRICGRCRHVNSKAALACTNCGSSELSDIAGEIPFWIILLKFLFWLFLILLAMGFILHFASFVPFLIVIGLLLIGYNFLPEEVKKIMNIIFSHIKQRVFGVKEKN